VSSRTGALLGGLLAAAGLALFLWPALSAPVVVSSDSVIDLGLAREGRLAPAIPEKIHVPKPGYVLFLMVAQRILPGLDEARAVVVVQSVLAWAAIAGASLLASRRSPWLGLGLAAVLFSFLRFRDACSAVHSDALAGSLGLLLLALCWRPPRRAVVCGLLGASMAFLLWVRPNVGGVAILVGSVLVAGHGRRKLAALLFGFGAVIVPAWIVTRAGSAGQSGLGVGPPLLMGSATYYWSPSLNVGAADFPADPAGAALRSWREFFADLDVDRRRELAWRIFHGLLGTELYDARWSSRYAAMDAISRGLSPLLVIAAVALILAAPFETRTAKLASALLLALLLLHDLAFGSHPRYILPFLPALFFLSLAGAKPVVAWGRRRTMSVVVLLLAGLALLRAHPAVLDGEWGLVERVGVRIAQTIPERSLPERGPATLHVRIASPVLPTGAGLEVFGPGGSRLYTSADDPYRDRPAITMAIPDAILEANRRGPIAIDLVSTGRYDSGHFLLFPVIPRPWAPEARRADSPELSPGTGISTGSLDWWAHAGAD
jgi:hypothetical protein